MSVNEIIIALYTLVRREILRFMRIWIQTLAPAAVSALLYIVIFGSLVGAQMKLIDGFNYIDYIVPGIIMMAVITNSYSNVVSSFFSQKVQRNIEEMLVSPLPNIIILTGFVAGGVGRGLCVGVVVTVVSLLFADIHITNPLITISIVILTSIVFAIAGFINAIFAKSYDDISMVPNFVLTPLTYFGGVFYSVSLLPQAWQTASLFNPVLYMINGFRYGILGVSDIAIEHAFLIIFSLIIVFGAVALLLLKSGAGIKQ